MRRTGNVGDVLRTISRLQSLTTLDFTNQFLTGALPADVSFPALEVLQLANNYITVRELHLCVSSCSKQ